MKIKFNMDFHGEYIRNLEDLRNNFSVEDILEAYDNGLLVKWLDARYYTNELKQVQAIEAKNARGVLEELIRIFSPETEQREIDAEIALYDYLSIRREYREFVKANGLEILREENKKLNTEVETLNEENERLNTELEALKKEHDALRQKNERMGTEHEALRKENENLKHKVEQPKQSSSSLIEAKIPAGFAKLIWEGIRGRDTPCRIKDIGNCGGKLKVSSVGAYNNVFTIEEAIEKQTIFNGLEVSVRGVGLHGNLYFYYEEV